MKVKICLTLDKNNMKKDNLLYGMRPVMEAISSEKEIDKVFIQKNLRGDNFTELMNLIKKNSIPFQFVPVEKLNKLTMKNHQGIVCFVSTISYTPIENVIQMIYDNGESPLILVLDRITDVRNLGAIARTAECSGVHAILLPSKGGAQINADALKTSAGALHKIPVSRTDNLKSSLDYLKKSGLQIVVASEKTDNYFNKCDFTIPTALIMGSEEDGVSPEYLKMADKLVSIPVLGDIASLNVSVACGIVLYEAVMQRLEKK